MSISFLVCTFVHTAKAQLVETIDAISLIRCSAILGVGVDLFDFDNYDQWFDDESTMTLPQTGTYTGPTDIAEYVAFVQAEYFVNYRNACEYPAYLFTKATSEECKVLFAYSSRVDFNPNITAGGLTVETLQGFEISYSVTSATTVLINTAKVYYPEAYLEYFFTEVFSTDLTGGYVCDIMEEKCSDTFALNDLTSDTCRSTLKSLPLTDEPGSYIDGNSQGCRSLHAAFAKDNSNHCPHLSFTPETDVFGNIKCQESSFLDPEVVFSAEIISHLKDAGELCFGLGEDGFLLRETEDEAATCPLTIADFSTCYERVPTSAPSSAPTSSGVPTSLSTSSGVPTSSSTSMPSTDSANEIDVDFCFSPLVKAEVLDKGRVMMKDLVVGDKVLTASGEYKTMFSMSHYHKSRDTSFLRIRVDTGVEQPLEISHNHLLFTEAKEYPVPAASIKVGDKVLTTSSGFREVVELSRITRKGLYNPLTMDGTIVVDGIVASTYTSSTGNSHINIGGLDLLSFHNAMDIASKPYRTLCTSLSLRLCNNNSNERSSAAQFLKFLFYFSLSQNNAVKCAMFISYVTFFGTFAMLVDLRLLFIVAGAVSFTVSKMACHFK